MFKNRAKFLSRAKSCSTLERLVAVVGKEKARNVVSLSLRYRVVNMQ